MYAAGRAVDFSNSMWDCQNLRGKAIGGRGISAKGERQEAPSTDGWRFDGRGWPPSPPTFDATASLRASVRELLVEEGREDGFGATPRGVIEDLPLRLCPRPSPRGAAALGRRVGHSPSRRTAGRHGRGMNGRPPGPTGSSRAKIRRDRRRSSEDRRGGSGVYHPTRLSAARALRTGVAPSSGGTRRRFWRRGGRRDPQGVKASLRGATTPRDREVEPRRPRRSRIRASLGRERENDPARASVTAAGESPRPRPWRRAPVRTQRPAAKVAAVLPALERLDRMEAKRHPIAPIARGGRADGRGEGGRASASLGAVSLTSVPPPLLAFQERDGERVPFGHGARRASSHGGGASAHQSTRSKDEEDPVRGSLRRRPDSPGAMEALMSSPSANGANRQFLPARCAASAGMTAPGERKRDSSRTAPAEDSSEEGSSARNGGSQSNEQVAVRSDLDSDDEDLNQKLSHASGY
ncbi:hypothetical protein THAOC_29166 [Thalassiosira oceanica]|uniref:Uncharacterized protein n=1 Tax=Thalassiosira oceanica TaxID=159749 RepID=K0REL4_THAOC|nr:hypothetical protein THAOC_29166 [Thalassiosira oceanica]|eukprot:EJK51645.1 hypothetical protein THAOC_29166 [Thalassiosira oceanica]